MSSRPLLTKFFLAVLAIVAFAGWWWGWQERHRAGDADFLRRRLDLVDADNRRLAQALIEQQRVNAAAADRPRRAEIERTVARLRGLEFRRPVVYKEIPRAELPAILRQKLSQQVPDQEFGNTGTSLAALGLLPAGIDLKKTYLDLLGEQIGAFYDQHSAELFTFSGQSLDNAQNRVILAHELTHALEDQQFHLERLPLEAKGNDDRAIAASALVEGDATLVMSQYMLGDLSASALKDSLAGAFNTDIRQIVAAPRYLRETLLFPYLRGQEFCQALYQTGGWEALAEAFRRPPDNTSQILHPEKFLTRGDGPPLTVDFPTAAVPGHEPIGNNVLGEFGVRQWLAKWLKNDAEASETAAGWQADRYLVYGDARDSSYLWKSVWSSPVAASKFADAAVRCWCERYHLDPKALTDEPTAFGHRLSLPNGHHLAARQHDAEVILLDAQDNQWEDSLHRLVEDDSTTKSVK